MDVTNSRGRGRGFGGLGTNVKSNKGNVAC